MLIVEREPRDIYFTGTFKYSRRYVHAASIIFHNHICRIRTVETFVGAGKSFFVVNLLTRGKTYCVRGIIIVHGYMYYEWLAL